MQDLKNYTISVSGGVKAIQNYSDKRIIFPGVKMLVIRYPACQHIWTATVIRQDIWISGHQAGIGQSGVRAWPAPEPT